METCCLLKIVLLANSRGGKSGPMWQPKANGWWIKLDIVRGTRVPLISSDPHMCQGQKKLEKCSFDRNSLISNNATDLT